jgi:predicted nucleic acid-binding protein
MEVTHAAERRWLLLDKSALVRGGGSSEESLGQPSICPITRMEMLQSARSAADYQQVEQWLAAFHELRMNAETIATAVTAHRELGQKGRHRLPIPDLLIAACAQQHQAAVLHVDRHYDVLAEVLAFEPVRLTP